MKGWGELTADEVKNLLKIYYDIPQMIAEEFATIRNCETEMNKIALPSVNLSGLPGGKGVPGDRTANMALADPSRYYNEEIKRCSRRIEELRDAKNWMGVALDRLDKTDRYILELAGAHTVGRHGKKLPAGWIIPRARPGSECVLPCFS